jgi:uncharacterized protein (TIGR00369 family)
VDVSEFDPSTPVINSDVGDHWCFGCGNLNESGLKLRFHALTTHAVWATFTPTKAHEGYLGMTHGGIIAAALDEAMSWAVTHEGNIGVTARMTIAFRRPARVGTSVRVIGTVLHRRSRTIDTHAEIRDIASGELLAEADARFVRITSEQAAEWRAGYGEQAEGSAFGIAMERHARRAPDTQH